MTKLKTSPNTEVRLMMCGEHYPSEGVQRLRNLKINVSMLQSPPRSGSSIQPRATLWENVMQFTTYRPERAGEGNHIITKTFGVKYECPFLKRKYNLCYKKSRKTFNLMIRTEFPHYVRDDGRDFVFVVCNQ